MREPARQDPSPRPLVALASSAKPGVLDRLAGRLRRRGSEQDDHLRAELERLRIVQRQLENAQLYLTAATQVPIEAGFITKRAARLERDVQTLIHIVARYRL